MTPDVAQAFRLLSRSHALRGNLELRAAESTGPVSSVIRYGPEGVCSERCRQLVMGSVSHPEDGGPSRTGTAVFLLIG